MGYTVTSPLPGSVWEVKVAVGEKGEEDQVILVLEAMKMENEIYADSEGTVKEILVEKGSVVKAGDPLVIIE